MSRSLILATIVFGVTAFTLSPQVVPPGFGPRVLPEKSKKETKETRRAQPDKAKPPQAQPAKPGQTQQVQPAPKPGSEAAPEAPAKPAQPGAGAGAQAGTPEAAGGAEQPGPQPPAPPPAKPRTPTGSLNLQNAALTEVIDALCRQLKINYILDPRVKGGVILNTYGDTSKIDTRQLLDLILRINGAAMVQVGEIYRIVPIEDAPRLPIPPEVNPDTIPLDEQVMLNLVFLKYVTVEEIAKVIEPFIGEGATTWAYPPANLLLILDNRRNMRRTMELINLFDSDVLARRRVRLFETKHRRPSELAEELETVLKSISLSEEETPIRFLPIDRLNLIVTVAPNPGAFETVEEWLKKLDQPVKVTAGTVDNYVYRVKYRRAEILALAIMQLYGGGYGGFGLGGFGAGGFGGLFTGAAAGFGNRYTSLGGLGVLGLAPGGYGGYGGYGAYGGYGGFGGFGAYGGYGAYGGGGFGPGPGATYGASTYVAPNVASRMAQQSREGESAVVQGPASFSAPSDQTGTYLGAGAGAGYGAWSGYPRVIPNPLDNTLLIQATPQQYRQIMNLLEKIDTPPRQVLIDAKIYEVTLTGAFSAGVSAFLKSREQEGGPSVSTLKPLGDISSAGFNFSIGALVDQSRELLAFLQAQENTTRAKVIAAPSIIATDSVPASINVGTEVPVLTAQAVSPIQTGGTSLFTNAIANRDSGVTLSVLARVNPSGIVTLIIDQEVSAPQPPPVGGIQSPSFTKRTVRTQVTLRDGDTIAIGGIINETETESSAGLPFLHRLPVIGYAFGGKSKSKQRTELVIFMTPRVIYDTNQITEATDELKSRFRRLARELERLE